LRDYYRKANSGSVRTISSTGHNLVAGNYVQVGTVSGATHTSCAVSNVSANAFDITVPSTKDYDGTSPSIPTSGTLYYCPAFDHRNTVHHGNCVVVRHASFSQFDNCKFDRHWTGGLMVRFSSYCVDNDCEFLRLTSANTDNNNLNGRLGYGRQNYGLSKKNISYRPVGKGGRHLYTDSCPETNSAFSAANWYQHVGGPVDCEVIDGHSDGATGGPWDTHPGSNRTKFTRCTSKDANRGAHEGSYFGHFGQARGSNVTYQQCAQEGGSHGVRIINEINQPGSVHYVDLLARNLTDNGNDSAALRVENMSGVTAANRPLVRGRLRCYNAGWGFYVQDEADVVLSEYVYEGISERAGTVIDDGKVHIDNAVLDFRDNPLNLSTREAFVLEDAAQLTIGTLIIRQGSESDQPTAIFKDNDNASGKKVGIGRIIYDDPDNVGPIPLVTPGREGNFTWLYHNFKHYVAGRYYFPQFFISTGTAGAVSAGRLYAVPIEILTPTTFTKIGINVTTGATGSPVMGRLGIYKDHKGVPGALVVDAGEVDVTSVSGAGGTEATISKTLFGRYWLAVIFESASSLQITLQSSASTNVGDYGAEGPVGGANVLRPSVTYGPLPSTYPSVTSASFDTANIPRIWLRAGV
jgi:hypothetical protein